jgi:3-deoxy-D-manno-octulosonic-acid transferase
MLEPAAWGLPILTGPSDFNFREISALLEQAGALEKCEDAAAIAAVVSGLFDNADARAQRGAAAIAVIDANRGALDKLLAEIRGVLLSVARSFK